MNSISTINFEYNSFVKLYMDSYLIKDQKLISKMLAISKHYFPIFEQKLDKYNLPLELKYLSVVESSLNTRAKSPSGALGLWQFMYPTAKEYGLRVTSYIDERLDPFKSTEGLDRGGLVGADGATHHGVFDLAYLRCIPNMIVSAPIDEHGLRDLMYTAQKKSRGPFAIRYPRGKGVKLTPYFPYL